MRSFLKRGRGGVRWAPVLVFLFSALFSFAQRTRNEYTVRHIPGGHYFRFYYENDVTSGTDYYYTSGMNIDLVNPFMAKNPLNKLFFRLPSYTMKYGIALDHYAFTPLHIIYREILYGDRPYAGCLSLSSFRIATSETKRQQVSTSLALGVIGPPALWKPVQTRLHKNLIAAPEPEGWDNQIRTDPIISYRLGMEKNLVSQSWLLLNACLESVAGTLNDKLGAGLSLMAGRIDDPFRATDPAQPKKKKQVYLFAVAGGSMVGYDATLQGGLFNRKNPYTIASGDITRFTLNYQAGIMVQFSKFYLELAQNGLTKEFRTGLSHHWGSLGIAWTLK